MKNKYYLMLIFVMCNLLIASDKMKIKENEIWIERFSYLKERDQLPVEVINLVKKFVNEDNIYIGSTGQISKEILEKTVMPHRGPQKLLDEEYLFYLFLFENEQKNQITLHVLYSNEQKKAYILNEGYDFKKISLKIKNRLGNLSNIVEEKFGINSLPMAIYPSFSYTYMKDIYNAKESHLLLYELPEDTDLGNYIILDPNVTTEQIESAHFWPALTVSADRFWNLIFVVYCYDGSIKKFNVKGNLSDDNYLIIGSIDYEVLFPKGTIKINW